MGNEFQQQADAEQKRVQSEQLSAILGIVQTLEKEVKAVRKENRTIREELRNLDKLRPLRSAKEEAAEQDAEASEEVAEQAAQK